MGDDKIKFQENSHFSNGILLGGGGDGAGGMGGDGGIGKRTGSIDSIASPSGIDYTTPGRYSIYGNDNTWANKTGPNLTTQPNGYNNTDIIGRGTPTPPPKPMGLHFKFVDNTKLGPTVPTTIGSSNDREPIDSSRLPLPSNVGSPQSGETDGNRGSKNSKSSAISDTGIGTSTPHGKFHIWSRYYIITYKHHLNKSEVIRVFMDEPFNAIKVRVAHELGKANTKIPYEHSHVYVDFGKPFHSQNARVFDYAFHLDKGDTLTDEVHPNIGPICKKKHLNRVYRYMCKEDHDNDDMLEWITKDTVAEDIWDCKTLQDALKHAERFSDVSGIIAAFNARPSVALEVTPVEFVWQMHLLNLMTYTNTKRKIHWIYDSIGGMGKSDFCAMVEDKFNKDVAVVTQFGGAKDAASMIGGCLEEGWTGKILILDIPRGMEDHSIYIPLEMIKNGRITDIKWKGKRYRFKNAMVLVMANFYPRCTSMTGDRWQIWSRHEHQDYFKLKLADNPELDILEPEFHPAWVHGGSVEDNTDYLGTINSLCGNINRTDLETVLQYLQNQDYRDADDILNYNRKLAGRRRH